jgi:hypothetical protein
MVLRLNMPTKQEEAKKLAAEKPRKALPLQLDPKHEIKRAHSLSLDDEISKHLGSWRIGAH